MQAGTFHTELEEFLSGQGLNLADVIYGPVNPVVLEKEWLEVFSEKEFSELGILRYFPRMIRGMPRVYRRESPGSCRIKREFADLGALKRLGAAQAFLSLYEAVEVTRGARVAVFTWVMGDGWGDLIAGREVIRILQERFAELEVRWVVLLPEKRIPPEVKGDFKIYWNTNELQTEALHALRTSDCVLQVPTMYPKTALVQEMLKEIPLSVPLPRWVEIGEYGFVETDWFHPKSGRYSLGLHCLEKGILVHKSKVASFAEVKNEALLLQLFETQTPGPLEIEKYLRENAFYLSYLTTVAGGVVYLQALLKAHEHDEKRIDLCTPDLKWLIQLIQENKVGELQSVQEIEIYLGGERHGKVLGGKGKRLRVICPGTISDEDFRSLVRLSGEFVGVRGNQSFSEAISANKVYFYDGREHAQYFIRDLTALAENRIGAHRNALEIFRAMRKTFLHNLPEETGEWVEETHFQEREPLVELGLQVGRALQDPDAIAGFKKLGRIVTEEYAANACVCHVVQKELCHSVRPDLARAHEAALEAFGSGTSFPEAFLQLASQLDLEKKLPVWKIRPMHPEESHQIHQQLGIALRALIQLCAKGEIHLKVKEISRIATAIGGPLATEAEALERHLKSFSESALHLEQETREI